MASSLWLIGLVVLTALIFDYINGFHDTANAIATTVLTGALSVPRAILLAAGLNFVGALLSKSVATTIGKGIVDPHAVTTSAVLAALLGAIGWNLYTWWKGLPSSSSHALIGGIVGAVVAQNGFSVFHLSGLKLVGLALLLSPLFGFIVGTLFMTSLLWAFRRAQPGRLNRYFKVFQVVSASSMALSHGSNDAQKTMGIITMALASGGLLPDFHVPLWVVLSCGAAMALGTAAGGWRIIKTVGRKVMTLQPIHGFAAETAGAGVIFLASGLGAPVSTTHVISSSIMGVGSCQSMKGVRWNVVKQIVGAWLLTLPASAVVAWLLSHLFRYLLG